MLSNAHVCEPKGASVGKRKWHTGQYIEQYSGPYLGVSTWRYNGSTVRGTVHRTVHWIGRTLDSTLTRTLERTVEVTPNQGG